MSPEVSLKRPYNELADVYSFAHILYNIMALEKPYHDYSKSAHRTKVARSGERPPIDCEWPTAIQELLEKAWSPRLSQRPVMTEVIAVLNRVISELTRGKVSVSDASTVLSSESFEQAASAQLQTPPMIAPSMLTISFRSPIYKQQMI